MSDGTAKAEFAHRADTLEELAVAERRLQSARTNYEQAERNLVQSSERLLGAERELSRLRNEVLKLYPDATPIDPVLEKARETMDRFCTRVGREQEAIATLNALDNPDRVSEDSTLLDPAVLRDEPEIPQGFTRWEGGKCPVPFGSAYEWLERSGETYTDTHDEEGNLWRWVHNGGQDDLIAYRIITPEAEPEPEGYAPVVDAEPVLDATELAQVTIDKVPPTAEVIKDQTGRAKFALFGGQTHEVVEPSNTEADFWARALFPKKKEQA